jgi:acylphosphatase
VVQYKIEINGRVQGVGFRYFVQKRAEELNIKGWVKNTPRGSVEVMAQGDKTDVDTFTDYLRMGPSMARVKNLSKTQMPELENFTSFEVRF